MTKRRIVVGMSGATGTVYGVRLLELLRELNVETHLVITRGARLTRGYETDWTEHDIRERADFVHPPTAIGASIASGSFPTMGMIVAPCSVRSLSEIATGVTSSLLTRAADVTLKERRRLVLMVRETPLTLGHLRSMVAVTENGAIVFPPVPAFYTRPNTIDEIVDHTAGRVLDLFGLDAELARWNGIAELTWNPDKSLDEG